MNVLARESWLWSAKKAAAFISDGDVGLFTPAIPYVFAAIPVGILFLPLFLAYHAPALTDLPQRRPLVIVTGIFYVVVGIWAVLK